MHSKNILFIVASLTSTSLGLNLVTARRSLDIFLARQLNASACASLCQSVGTTLDSCTTPNCLCTTTIAASVQGCVNCAVADDPTISVVSDAQMIIDSFENVCSDVGGVPSITIDTNDGASSTSSQSAPTSVTLPGGSTVSTPIVQSTLIVPPIITVPQTVIGPSSTTSAPSTSTASASSVGSTSTTAIGGLPLTGSASPKKIILHWTGALLGLAAGTLLVF